MREPDEVFEPQAPAVRNAVITQAVDGMYRDMETAGEVRAEAAAMMTPGLSASDFSMLKTTDLPKQPKAPPQPNPGYMQWKQPGMPLASGFGGAAGQPAQNFAAQVGSGPFPFAGAQTANQFQNAFASKARAIQAAGQIGKA